MTERRQFDDMTNMCLFILSSTPLRSPLPAEPVWTFVLAMAWRIARLPARLAGRLSFAG